ncbi:MAG: urease accessory protein UreD [Cyanobacteria bacterium J06627_28]
MVVADSNLLTPRPVGEKAALEREGAQLSLRVACAANRRGTGQDLERSFVAHQYATYPFRLSNNLSLDPRDPGRVHAYIMNAGPGLLAGDDLRVVVEVGDRASLYLTDQSATKVHSKPPAASPAQMTHTLTVGSQAYLEYVPEPIIFFPDAALKQKTHITLHPQGRLFFSEMVVPGRLARGEFYEFEQFENHLQINAPEGTLRFVDRLKLPGKSNPFRDHAFLTDYPILGSFIIIAPEIDLASIFQAIKAIDISRNTLQFGSSPLPNCHGLIVRAMATQTRVLKSFQTHLLSTLRQQLSQPLLPEIPK